MKDIKREEVDLIASGYEWICPKCEQYNTEIAIPKTLVCKECNEIFNINPDINHAYE